MTCWTSQYLTLPSSSKICTPSPTLSARSAFCKGLGDPCLGGFCGQEFYPPLPNRSDLWNFGAGHHVGLDHAGHMFYCRESRGRRKLDQMDTEISGFLIQLIDHPHLGHEKTLLLRFGDRGMTLDGDTWKWKSGRSRVGATGRRRCETRRRNASSRTTSLPSSCVEHLRIARWNRSTCRQRWLSYWTFLSRTEAPVNHLSNS